MDGGMEELLERGVELDLSFGGLKSLFASADGAMPWRADHQRRTLLYRYSSRGFSAHSGVEAPAGPAYREELSPLGQAILECANDHLLPAHLARLVQPQSCNGSVRVGAGLGFERRRD